MANTIDARRVKQLRRALQAAGQHAMLGVVGLVVLVPLVYIVLASFKTRADYIGNQLGLPRPFVLDNYASLLAEGRLFLWLANTAVVTAVSVGACTLIALLGAFAFAKMRFPGKDRIFNLLISLMIIPPIVMLIPLFVLSTQVRLVNTYWSAIIIDAGLMLPFSVYLLRNFFVTVPESIMNSARIDGCSDLGILFRIMLPLSSAAIITLTVVNVLWVWNELLIALIFLQKNTLTTLMVGLVQFQGRFKVNQPALLAGVFLSMIPMFVIYAAGQKFFVQGLTAGALKGE
jgi:ABC-type glycerol-3-phosphate transport system permease component